jgi:Flp pilus assembly protein TadG
MSRLHSSHKGQGLIEASLLLPFLLVIVFNAINIGYFFFVYLNLATAPRQGAQYSILGGATTVGSLPAVDTVYSLVNEDIGGAISGASNPPTRICTAALGVSTPADNTQVPLCQSYNSGNIAFSAVQPDPEAPAIVLNRVDIAYTVSPLIAGGAFNLVMPSSLTFHRLVYMRAEQ